jgi:hypothetical protein
MPPEPSPRERPAKQEEQDMKKKVSLLRSEAPVNVDIGAGANPPKVVILRAEKPVKAEVGAGANPPKIAVARSKAD